MKRPHEDVGFMVSHPSARVVPGTSVRRVANRRTVAGLARPSTAVPRSARSTARPTSPTARAVPNRPACAATPSIAQVFASFTSPISSRCRHASHPVDAVRGRHAAGGR